MENPGAAGGTKAPVSFAVWATVSVVVVLVVVASVFVVEGGLGGPQPAATHSTSFSVTSTKAPSPSHGLELSLTLNSSSMSAGGGIAAMINEANTMTTPNNVSSSGDWPIEGLAVGPCGPLNYPIGLAVLSGNYDISNVSSGKALQIYPLGMASCPMILAGIGSFVFQASSDNATVFGSCQAGDACLSERVYSIVSFKGYWSETPQGTAFTSFPSGVYTVVAGDEWGGLVILHFVAGSGS